MRAFALARCVSWHTVSNVSESPMAFGVRQPTNSKPEDEAIGFQTRRLFGSRMVIWTIGKLWQTLVSALKKV